MRHAFEQFVTSIPFYGLAIMCIDHPEVQALIPRVLDRRVVTYGLSPQADIRALNVEMNPAGTRFDVEISERVSRRSRFIRGVRLPMLGNHNVQNALAAIAVAIEMDIADDTISGTLGRFGGVKRRFTRTGIVAGITIVDDYGHHPVEIAAVLQAARTAVGTKGKVIAVVQPHRYSRLASLFEEFCTCFNDANTVVVAEVYAAGEEPIEGIDRDALVEGLRDRGHRSVLPLDGPDALAATIKDLAGAGDMVVCLGAGNISAWANNLPAELQAIYAEGPKEVRR